MVYTLDISYNDEPLKVHKIKCTNRTEYYHIVDILTQPVLKYQINYVNGYRVTSGYSKQILQYDPYNNVLRNDDPIIGVKW